MVRPNLICSWLQDSESAESLSDFFVSNVTLDYVSHGEILTGRATDKRTWSPNLREIICRELATCVESFCKGASLRAATAIKDGRIVGLTIAEIDRSTSTHHAWIHDLVVDRDSRLQGIGTAFLEWIENELRREKVRSVFIESGINNDVAHAFFKGRGYSVCSQVMNKVI